MEKIDEFFTVVAKGLSQKAEALLVFSLAVIASLLMWFGVDPWLACGFMGGLYILYILRAERSEAHDERMAEKDVEKIEKESRARLAQRRQRMIAKKTK